MIVVEVVLKTVVDGRTLDSDAVVMNVIVAKGGKVARLLQWCWWKR